MSETFAAVRDALAGRYGFEKRADSAPPLLGLGGMAEVYLATDLRLNRPVALKVLRPVIAQALGPERFLREIQVATRLAHPNILPLFEAGSSGPPDAPLLWYAMPYVPGGSLRDLLDREGQLPIEQALRIAREIAEALASAHASGFVHRDIKPENVLLEGDHAVVADFGLARATSGISEVITSSGIVVGTPAYMSPEQGSGRQRIDGRSDIYSLGCVLYEMLAGEPPFAGATPQAVIARHQMEALPSLRVVRRTISVELEALVERALAKSPADRFASAAEFAAQLALPPERWKHRPTRRRSLIWSLSAALVLALVAWLLWSPRGGNPDPNRIVIFPVAGPVGTTADSGLAAGATEALLSALNSTSSLAGVDGRRLGTAGSDRSRAASVGGGFYLTSTLVASDSLRLNLELHSLLKDTIIGRTLTFRPAANGWEVGMQAARQVLPLLFPAARGADFPLLTAVAPAALAEFFRGEQRYRQAAFEEALGHYWRAVEADSGFALAALRGAQAATWTSRPDQARALVAIAMARSVTLPQRFRGLVNGLDAYLHGRADSAVSYLRGAVREDENSPEGWMLLGETFTHLLPSDSPLDSLAEDAFRRTHRLDSTFTPVLFHLIEIAARRGDTVEGARVLRTFRAGNPDSIELGSAELMLRCVTRPLAPEEWREAVHRHPDQVRVAAYSLSVAGLRQPACARQAWQSLVAFDANPNDGPALSRRFAALVGLQNVLVASGRDSEVRALWDADTLFNRGFGQQYLVLDALATGRFVAPADSFARARLAELATGDTVISYDLWLAGSWAARRGQQQEQLRAAADRLTESARGAHGDRVVSLLARSLAAQQTLSRGDTAGAIRQLGALAPNVTETNLLAWQPWESLGYERLLLTDLLLARRRYPEALRVAAGFDAPAPVAYGMYLPAILTLRARAADAWDEQALARKCRTRITEVRGTLDEMR